MPYVKKHTTLVLFFLVILSVSVLTVSIIHYQQSLTVLNDVIREKQELADSVSAELNKVNSEVNNLKRVLNLKEKREENLSGQYTTLKVEEEKVKEEKAYLEMDLSETRAELEDAEDHIDSLEDDLIDIREDYDDLNQTYYEILSDVEDICDDASSLNISECGDYI